MPAHERRQYIHHILIGGVSAILIPLSGCLSSGLSIEGTESEVRDGQTVVVLVAVMNPSNSSQSGTLTIQCNVIAGDTYTRRRQITVLGSETNSYQFVFNTNTSDINNQYQITTSVATDGPLDNINL
ncbi:hypothetical protein [Haloquadratum walsbyi]|uniref:CARDB domain-containing protein n=1 Tax=Haloquadratum walsbyi J07HQW2 TaxID=1238425 RepID=U1PTB2_9EURY|nr:hypothetical protein [Haloquadratum walsbyi]ERG97037.1 MAG: hypothetical protein J07HQW2_03523 [Haloquadratum walsbyi J07HQW2]